MIEFFDDQIKELEDAIAAEKDKSLLLSLIANKINSGTIDNLNEYLIEDVDWFSLNQYLVPRTGIRNFAKSIKNKNVRLKVLSFLQRYSDHYFHSVYEYSWDGREYLADNIADFQHELSTLVEQVKELLQVEQTRRGVEYKEDTVSIQKVNNDIPNSNEIIENEYPDTKLISTEFGSYEVGFQQLMKVLNTNKRKVQKCRDLYELQSQHYIDLDQYASDNDRAKAVNSFKDTGINEDSFQKARTPLKKKK